MPLLTVSIADISILHYAKIIQFSHKSCSPWWLGLICKALKLFPDEW